MTSRRSEIDFCNPAIIHRNHIEELVEVAFPLAKYVGCISRQGPNRSRDENCPAHFRRWQLSWADLEKFGELLLVVLENLPKIFVFGSVDAANIDCPRRFDGEAAR